MRPTLALAALLVMGCTTVSKERGHDEVDRLVKERSGQSTGWQQGGPAAEEIARRVQELLKGGLSRDGAIAIALVNNSDLQTTYEELGISQADLIQAGLLKNPSLTAHVGFPVSPNTLSELQFSLVQDVLDLIILPLRKSIAADQFAVDVRRVAGRALEVVANVKKAYVNFQAAQRALAIRKTLTDAAQASAQLAEEQFNAGNVPELQLVERQAAYEQLRLEVGRNQVELESRRQELNTLLGLWGQRADWSVPNDLEDPPEAEANLSDLESVALRQRPDVDAARRQAELFQKAVDLARNSRFVGAIDVGVDYHRDADGPRVAGPSLRLELPIFDQRQAVIARLEAQQRQSEHRLSALAVAARNDVRAARMQLQLARLAVDHYRDKLLPLRERAVELAQLHYNGMLVGLPALLAVKQDEMEAQRAFTEARRDYWVARAELERAVGGRLVARKAP